MFDMWLLLLLHLAGTLENASERSCTAPYQVYSLPVDTSEACLHQSQECWLKVSCPLKS